MKSRSILLPLFVFLVIVFSSFSFFVFADDNKNEKSVLLDSDQDGLSDQEEKSYGTDPNNADTDGDGYSDGVELRGGYDPLKPAPGDKIINNSDSVVMAEGVGGEQDLSEDENLTNELSKNVANLISDAKLSGEDLSLADIDELVNTTLTSKVSFEDLPNVNEDEIKIKKQNYSKLDEDERKEKENEDTLEYLTAVSYLALDSFPYKISEEKDLEKFSLDFVSQFSLFLSASSDSEEYFSGLAEKGEDFLDALKEIEVPENLLENHIQGMQLANYVISMKGEMTIDQTDPISSLVQLSKIQGLITLTEEYVQEMHLLFITAGISEIPIEL
ncbi:MAG: OmpA domain-containing protein [Candidatus Moranbacteria bacterium GW2011_GWE2_35_2-]|nr:MAG: OmpA domain-containing protein [Candidatus Moranbacteria bacterium GW2011_GWE2_35_2-]KKQ06756.1 MAG: OmpA domain-containing protein [Candidatus Moranbacteria bacterium GW2011_GWF1_36_4]KKQ22495.1 MAG: OmpA domain-containing protein [Candidatus Moranbacteria bacterium GW2011_GWF2_37_11]KKQ29564.1 MAG: OmpA domain-containing protein [Candidatus Moranbacteria bacterium GW2011_GWD1_37_17]KKQ30565.1 MAG: OmpA domain-containing protein [Candidatus Moranbacteria bacterium GW2011_GWE1_37_24]KK